MKFFYLALVATCLWTPTAFSQRIKLINPREVIEEASVLYDSAKYAECAAALRSIPERDTAYTQTLADLAYTHIDLKEFDKAIAICNERIAKPIEERAHFMKIRGIALGKKEVYAEAEKAFEDAMLQYPTDLNIPYNLAMLHYVNKDYQKAESLFFKIIRLNPFYASCHLQLARLSILQGRKTHAMLAMGIYIGINQKDNKSLVLINNLVDNQVTDEGSVPPVGPNGFAKLDQIIKSRITLEEGFESKFAVKAPVVQQYEVLFDQLPRVTSGGDDLYYAYYMPVYKAIITAGGAEAFIYHLLSSSKIEGAAKWRSKNEKELKTFYETTNTALKTIRQIVTIDALGIKSESGWYNSSNQLTAIGKFLDEKRLGAWIFFHTNAERSAEGKYNDAGVKIGTWKYYHRNGKLKSIENYDTGEVTVYSNRGNKIEHFFLKNDEIDGDVELYYDSGPIREKLKFAAGERVGRRDLFFGDGTLQASYEYKAGQPDGPYLINYENGKLKERCAYKANALHGKYEYFFVNGRPGTIGEYSNGLRVGPWKYYYRNGQLRETGSFSTKGENIGEWILYNERGLITEKRNFDNEGKYHGDLGYYHDGKLYAVSTYKKDMLVKDISYDSSGTPRATFGNSNGSYHGKNYFSTGELRSEGEYVKGKAVGPWKFYNRYGVLVNEYFYKDNLLDGRIIDYYPSGRKKIECEYKDGKLHGYFQEFHENGKVKEEGWYQAGNREQQWLTYYQDGTLESDFYYIENKAIGKGYNYAVDGKKYSSVDVDADGNIVDLEYYGRDGSLLTKKRTEKLAQVYEDFYANKKQKTRYDVLCGSYHRGWDRFFPDGGLYYSYVIVNGKKNGRYLYKELNGTVSTEGQFEDDAREGLWKNNYANGKPYSEGNYLNGKRDSIWTYYHENGEVSSQGMFLHDKRDGVTRFFGPEGQPIIEKMYIGGELIAYRPIAANQNSQWIKFKGTSKIEIRYANGNLALQEEYRNGLSHSYDRTYYSNGKLYEEMQFADGELTGEYKSWHPNGKVFERGMYLDDERTGKWERFSEDGTLEWVESYLMGYRNGNVTIYKRGIKSKEVTIWNSFIEN